MLGAKVTRLSYVANFLGALPLALTWSASLYVGAEAFSKVMLF